VCTVFLRGCPVRCQYCQNRDIQAGEDFRDVEEIVGMIRPSQLIASGVIFSGGEPTQQKEPLLYLARAGKELGFSIGIHTNGVFPGTIRALLDERLVDKIALDIKTRWEQYDNLLKATCRDKVKESLELAKNAYALGQLKEFEVVVTLFPGCEDIVPAIARDAGEAVLVLQQGVYGSIPPLTFSDLKLIADRLKRRVKIRTREDGEVIYDNNQIIIANSIVLNDIRQARRNRE
jgi:pyruvate formate lyase activating enzyme